MPEENPQSVLRTVRWWKNELLHDNTEEVVHLFSYKKLSSKLVTKVTGEPRSSLCCSFCAVVSHIVVKRIDINVSSAFNRAFYPENPDRPFLFNQFLNK